MQRNDFQPKLDALASRYRRMDANSTRSELEELYTDSCAEMLRLEGQLLRLKRRLIAAEADSPHDPVAARDAAELRRLRDQVADDRAAVNRVVRLLRTAVDWRSASAPYDSVEPAA